MTDDDSPTPTADDQADQDAKELAKLTTGFYAALNELLPAAIRASKRGKHGLLRLISRKLPRPKLPTPEDPEADLKHDGDPAEFAEHIRTIFEQPTETPGPPPTKEEEKREEPPPVKTKAIAPPAPAPANPPQRTSGAPRSLNEEPWPGESSYPRPFHRRLKKLT